MSYYREEGNGAGYGVAIMLFGALVLGAVLLLGHFTGFGKPTPEERREACLSEAVGIASHRLRTGQNRDPEGRFLSIEQMRDEYYEDCMGGETEVSDRREI